MGNAIRVLLVDDDVAVAELTGTYLERTSDNIETVVETNPSDALDHVIDDAVDCVVSDYEMPEMDGLAFLADVREVEPDLPFVLFTGKGSEEIASEAISAGVTDYLQKEVGTDQYAVLANRVENAVAQHRAQQEAEAADEQIRRIFERITDAFFALDDDWRFRYVNERAADFFDRDPDELVGEDLREVFPESLGSEFHDAYRRAFDTQELTTVEAEMSVSPGTWIESRAYPSEDGLSVYGRDVTERRQTEEELRETKAKREALHDVAARAAACTSDQDIYDLAIEAAEEILAFDRSVIDRAKGDELVPQSVSKGIPSDGYYDTTPVDLDDNLAARAYREGESSLVQDVRETEVVPAENEYRSVLTVPFGESGVFQAVSKEPGAFDDDDRELAELLAAHISEALTRVQTETELRAERDRFAALFENVPNAVVRYEIEDGDAIGRSVNPAFTDVFGWSADEIVGDSVDDYILSEEQREEGKSLNQRIAMGSRIEGAEVHRKTRDGGRDFLLHTAPTGNDGETEAFAIYVDITEQKERERKLTRQNERLEEFASVVSHDLRNPLNVALGRYDLLEAERDSDHLEPIGRSLDRMDALVEDLLALARQGQVVDETEPTSLSEAATTAWETADTQAATLELADDLVVEADDARFRELLENLFRNSVEHAGSDATVEVGALDDRGVSASSVERSSTDRSSGLRGGDTASNETAKPSPGPREDDASGGSSQAERSDGGFYVEDDGPGIPDDMRDQIFDHGFTTDEGGTGFGLAIVASIADAHGWDAEAVDCETGARFEFDRVSVREDPPKHDELP